MATANTAIVEATMKHCVWMWPGIGCMAVLLACGGHSSNDPLPPDSMVLPEAGLDAFEEQDSTTAFDITDATLLPEVLPPDADVDTPTEEVAVIDEVILADVSGIDEGIEPLDVEAPCEIQAPQEPAIPFDSPAECQLRLELHEIDCEDEGDPCTELQNTYEWCQYGSCGRSNEATCAPFEIRRIGVPFVGQDLQGACLPRCRRYEFTEVVCGTTPSCEIHDAGYDLCGRNRTTELGDSLCERTWDCWVEQHFPNNEWCKWMDGLPGVTGYTHVMPYSRDRVGLPGTRVPFMDLDGACPPDEVVHPPLPAALANLPIKREPAVWFATWDDPLVPEDYTNESNACNDSLEELWAFVQGEMCEDR